MAGCYLCTFKLIKNPKLNSEGRQYLKTIELWLKERKNMQYKEEEELKTLSMTIKQQNGEQLDCPGKISRVGFKLRYILAKAVTFSYF